MAECGRNWTDDEIRALLAIWAEENIQRQSLGATRNATSENITRPTTAWICA